MKILHFFLTISLVLGFLSQDAYARPSEYEALKKKFSEIKALKFHFQEEDSATRGSIKKDGVLIRDVSTVSADVHVALGPKIHASVETSALSISWKSTGTIIFDGDSLYIHEVRGGKNNPGILTKSSWDYEERAVNFLANASPKFAALKNRPGCLPFKRIFYLSPGELWSPLDLYAVLDKHEVEDRTRDEDRAIGQYRWSVSLPDGMQCSRVELSIDSKSGVLMGYVSYNPFKGFTDQVQHVGKFSKIEINPEIPPELFIFKQENFPNTRLMDLDPAKSAEILVNMFATPAKLIFESFFSEKAESVEELSGSGSSWFSSDHHLRFKAAKLPSLKIPLTLKNAEPIEAAHYFLKAFPKDKDSLEEKKALSLKEYHEAKLHWWVLHNQKQGIFYVRRWTDE